MSSSLFKRTKSTLKEKFLIVQNDILQNRNLSFEAKGFLCYILSLPDDWIIYKSKIQKDYKIGRTKLDRVLKELKLEGYMAEIEMVRNDEGKFSGVNYLFYDEPVGKTLKTHDSKGFEPQARKPHADNPHADNQQLQSTNSNKGLINKKILFDEFWNLYGYKVKKQGAWYAWNKLTEEQMKLAIRATPSYVERTLHPHEPKGKEYKDSRAHPTTWLNGARWEDEIDTQPKPEDRVAYWKDGLPFDKDGRIVQIPNYNPTRT